MTSEKLMATIHSNIYIIINIVISILIEQGMINETCRHKRAPMSGNSKHGKNNLKIYDLILTNIFYVVDGWTDNIVFFCMSVNKSSYNLYI